MVEGKKIELRHTEAQPLNDDLLTNGIIPQHVVENLDIFGYRPDINAPVYNHFPPDENFPPDINAPVYNHFPPDETPAPLSGFTPASQMVTAPQPNKNSKKFGGKHTKMLTLGSKVRSMAIKCYDEQLPWGWQATCQAIRMIDKSKYQVQAIMHNRDIKENSDFWIPSYDKPHYHIIVRCVNQKERLRVTTFLSMVGVVYRQGVDDNLLANHGVETIGNYAEYSRYLTHETEKAVKDGKELYDITEIVSNLEIEEIEEIRNGYLKPSENRRVTAKELAMLDAEAYDLGYKLGDFDVWYGSLPFEMRSATKMRTIKESYNRGITAKIDEHEPLDRVCIFIRGDANSGKSYTTQRVLEQFKIKTYVVDAGGTGIFDRLTAGHQAIVLDDSKCPSLLNMCDQYICRPYRRQADNPPWCGTWFIVTSNISFDEWCEETGLRMTDIYGNRTPHGVAMHSRFAVGEIVTDAQTGQSTLVITEIGVRGDDAKKRRIGEKVAKFVQTFNKLIKDYRPTKSAVDDLLYEVNGLDGLPQMVLNPKTGERLAVTNFDDVSAKAVSAIIRSKVNKSTGRTALPLRFDNTNNQAK